MIPLAFALRAWDFGNPVLDLDEQWYLLVGDRMLLVLNLPLIGLWVRLLTIPKPWLYGGILVFATLGTLGANGAIASELVKRAA